MKTNWKFENGLLTAFNAETGQKIAEWSAPEFLGIGLCMILNANDRLSKMLITPFYPADVTP
jgi:hypothetical protein